MKKAYTDESLEILMAQFAYFGEVREEIRPYRHLLIPRGSKFPVESNRDPLVATTGEALRHSLDGNRNVVVDSHATGPLVAFAIDADRGDAVDHARDALADAGCPIISTPGNKGLHWHFLLREEIVDMFPFSWLKSDQARPKAVVKLGFDDKLELLSGRQVRPMPGNWTENGYYEVVDACQIPINPPGAIEYLMHWAKQAVSEMENEKVYSLPSGKGGNVVAFPISELAVEGDAPAELDLEGGRNSQYNKVRWILGMNRLTDADADAHALRFVRRFMPSVLLDAAERVKFEGCLRSCAEAVKAEIDKWPNPYRVRVYEPDLNSMMHDIGNRLRALGIEARFNSRRKEVQWRMAQEGQGDEDNWADMKNRDRKNLREYMQAYVCTPPVFDVARKTVGKGEDQKTTISVQVGGMKHNHIGRDNFHDALEAWSHENEADPFKIWLDGLPPWDGERRLEGLLERLYSVGKDYQRMARFVMRSWLVGAVSRAHEPGAMYQHLPVFMGPQWIGKSSILKALAVRDEWASDQLHLGQSLKEQVERIGGSVLVECPEFQGVGHKNATEVVNFVTLTEDRHRGSYERKADSNERQWVAAATSNSLFTLPVSLEGGRRFLLVKLDIPIDPDSGKPMLPDKCATRAVEHIQDNIEQLWAEALHWYNQGDRGAMPGEMLEYAMGLVERHALSGQSMLADDIESFLLDGAKEQDEDGPGMKTIYEPGEPFTLRQLCEFIEPYRPRSVEDDAAELLNKRFGCFKEGKRRRLKPKGPRADHWYPGKPILKRLAQEKHQDDLSKAYDGEYVGERRALTQYEQDVDGNVVESRMELDRLPGEREPGCDDDL